jgi:Zn-dependent oligopeptidase
MNNRLDGQLILSSICDSKDIDLRIGEDRIVLNACNYKLDIFVPVLIKTDEVITTFDTFTHILDLKIPLF